MDASEFIDEVSRLQKKLRARKRAQVRAATDVLEIRKVASLWPTQVRGGLPPTTASSSEVLEIDSIVREILAASYSGIQASTYVDFLTSLKEHVISLHVSGVSGHGVVVSRSVADADAGRLRALLERISPAIADSYDQVLADLQDANRKSFRGTANDLREILREVLDSLAPDEDVKQSQWYNPKLEGGELKRRPTMADKTRFIREIKGEGRIGLKQSITAVERADDQLGGLVRSTYDRGSAEAHTSQTRAEVRNQLRYVNAVLLELLGSGSE